MWGAPANTVSLTWPLAISSWIPLISKSCLHSSCSALPSFMFCKLIPRLSAMLSFQHHFPHCRCFCPSPSHRFLFPMWQQWLQFVSQLLPLLSPSSITWQTGDIYTMSRGYPMMSVQVFNKNHPLCPTFKVSTALSLAMSLTVVVLTFLCACHAPTTLAVLFIDTPNYDSLQIFRWWISSASSVLPCGLCLAGK